MTEGWLHVPQSGAFVNPVTGRCLIPNKPQAVLSKASESLPGSQVAPLGEDAWVLEAPLHEDTVRVLHNLGLPTAGLEPFHYHYAQPKVEGEFTAMDHQAETAAFIATHKRCYVFNTPRTGKTGSLILAFDYLQRVKGVPGAGLIISTVSTLGGVWERSLDTTLKDRVVVKIHGGIGKAARLEKLRTPADFYVINYDGVKMIEEELREMVVSGHITMVGIDELTHYGNNSSGLWKSLNRVINDKRRPCEYVCGLTGSPGGNVLAPYSWAKMVTPWTVGNINKTTWEGMVFYRWGSEVWKRSERNEAKELVTRILQPQIRFDKAELFEVPEVVTTDVKADLTPEQEEAYRRMIVHMVAEVGRAEQEKTTISAQTKAALIHKLFQISNGSVKTEGGEIITLDNSDRVSKILKIILSARAKVVVFAIYKAQVTRLRDQIRAAGISCECIHGGVTGTKRDKINQDFMHGKDPQVIVCHPTTTAFGVEYASASDMIFDGPPRVGTFIYSQALERLSSSRQKLKSINVWNVYATGEELESFKDINAGVQEAESVNKLFSALTKKGGAR